MLQQQLGDAHGRLGLGMLFGEQLPAIYRLGPLAGTFPQLGQQLLVLGTRLHLSLGHGRFQQTGTAIG
ncbi:hypothetical protein D3C72_2014810 [compost metagenome]